MMFGKLLGSALLVSIMTIGNMAGTVRAEVLNSSIAQENWSVVEMLRLEEENPDVESAYVHSIFEADLRGKDSGEQVYVVKYQGLPHVAGLDKTTLLVLDAENQYITQETFAADAVEISVLPSQTGGAKLLVLCTAASNGLMSQEVFLLHLGEKSLEQEDVSYFFDNSVENHSDWEENHPVNRDFAYLTRQFDKVCFIIADTYPLETSKQVTVYQWDDYQNAFQYVGARQTEEMIAEELPAKEPEAMPAQTQDAALETEEEQSNVPWGLLVLLCIETAGLIYLGVRCRRRK